MQSLDSHLFTRLCSTSNTYKLMHSIKEKENIEAYPPKTGSSPSSTATMTKTENHVEKLKYTHESEEFQKITVRNVVDEIVVKSNED
ncbi:hypothetical protein RYX36_016514 [Vicia faba]